MIDFTVYGKPEPQGSSRAWLPKGSRRPIVTSANKKLKPWRQQIAACALEFSEAAFGSDVPVEVNLRFTFQRPRSVSEKKRPGMTVKPDIDKLVRAVFDGITGILIHDDAQIVRHTASKEYGGPERVDIVITDAREL